MAENMDLTQLIKRADRVAYMDADGKGTKFIRMKGFTELSNEHDVEEYERKYIDEKFKRTDSTGMSTSVKYGFDGYVGNTVQEKIMAIHDDELIGDKAVVNIVVVDFFKKADGGENKFVARKRSWSVIPDGSGDGDEAYTYSGTLKSNGSIIKGKATVEADGMTCTFEADSPLSV